MQPAERQATISLLEHQQGAAMAAATFLPRALFLCVLAAVFPRVTLAGYCDGDWLSVGRVTRFTPGPCLGVSGIGATQNPQKTIYIIDRSDVINTYLRFPGQVTLSVTASYRRILSRHQAVGK